MDDNIFGVAPIIEGQGETNESAVEEISAPEGQAEETKEETVEEVKEQPLILGKFKSDDDLKKAHGNLCRKIEAELNLPYGTVKPAGEDLSEDYRSMEAYYTQLRQNKRQPVAPKQEQPQEDEEARFMNWFNEAVEVNPVAAYKELAKYEAAKMFNAYAAPLAPIVQERNTNALITSIANKYKDYFNYTDGITEEIQLIGQYEPDLLQSPTLFETAYLRAKTKSLEEQARTAFENGKKSFAEERNNKKKINNETPNKKDEGDALPEGITIIGAGDGIFL